VNISTAAAGPPTGGAHLRELGTGIARYASNPRNPFLTLRFPPHSIALRAEIQETRMSETQQEGRNPQVERRRIERFSCDFEITIEWGAAALRGRVRDISLAGMFVELDSPLWIGARFSAELALTQPVQLECVVRRVQPRRGMAVTYAAPGEPSRAVIDSLIQGFAAQ